MKKTMGICLFTVFLAASSVCIMLVWNTKDSRGADRLAVTEATEEVSAEREPVTTESMLIAEAYSYLIKEEDGVLVVYDKDGHTIVLETNIDTHTLDADTLAMLRKGIRIQDESELYDFLESYSS